MQTSTVPNCPAIILSVTYDDARPPARAAADVGSSTICVRRWKRFIKHVRGTAVRAV